MHLDAWRHREPLKTTRRLPEWIFELLDQVTAIDDGARIVGGALAALALGGRFGPAVPPLGCVIVASDSLGSERAALLEKVNAQFLIHIVSPSASPTPPLIPEPITLAENYIFTFQWLSLSRVGGRPVLAAHHPSTAADLAAGRLRVCLPAASPGVVSASRHYWERLFPGLVPEIAVESSIDTIQARIAAGQPRPRSHSVAFNDDVRSSVAAVLNWHSAHTAEISDLPLIQASCLPDSDPWCAEDAEFRAWLMSVTSLSSPTCSDPVLDRILAAQCSEQKPTHQGWLTYQHALYATLLLDTSACPASDRRALRLATLMHDVAKGKNLWTPGAHGAIGAKIWRKACDIEDVTEEEAQLITWLIRTHDYLGLLDRTINDTTFPGGLSPRRIRREFLRLGRPLDEALALNAVVMQADIGSVSSLRWLLPLTGLLGEVVRASAGRRAVLEETSQ